MMILIYLIPGIACILSIIGCSIFLYYYLKCDSIKYTFGMKHIAILQFSDLIMPFICLIPIYLIFNTEVYCSFVGPIFNFFLLFQSFWVAVISRYSYQVLCLGIDKDSLSIKKPAIIGLIISCLSCAPSLFFKCYQVNGEFCTIKCNPIAQSFLFIFNTIVLIVSWGLSFYSNWYLLKKLRRDLKNQSKAMKWSFIRLSVYPFITLVCLLPGIIAYSISVLTDSMNIVVFLGGSAGCLLIGFFNSIALGFTREFKDAILIYKRLKFQALIN